MNVFKKLKKRIKSTKIKAIYEDDLIEALSKMGILDDIKNGKYKCKICNTTINLENLQAVVPRKEGLDLVCFKSSCIGEYNSIINTKS